MRPRNIGLWHWKNAFSLFLTLAVLNAAMVFIAVEPALASRALVYNATGKDLRVEVNGRASLIPWSSPVHVFNDGDQGNLHFEMTNTDGELLKRDLEPDSTYVILYRVSHKSFALWRTEALETNLDKILAEHPATARAAVFNSTGRPMIFQYGPWKQGVSEELCVFTPNAKNPSNLKFQIVHPDLGSYGPLAQLSLHVVAFEEEKGYSFLSFKSWVNGLKTRLNGSEPQEAGPRESDGGRRKSLPVLQEDLKDS